MERRIINDIFWALFVYRGSCVTTFSGNGKDSKNISRRTGGVKKRNSIYEIKNRSIRKDLYAP